MAATERHSCTLTTLVKTRWARSANSRLPPTSTEITSPCNHSAKQELTATNAAAWFHASFTRLTRSTATWPPVPRRLREICVISGFRREVDENCALLSYYTASSGNSVPMFRNNLSVPYSGVKSRRGKHLPLRQTYSPHHLWKWTFSTMLQLGEIIAVWAWRELKLMERRKMWVHPVICDGRNIGLFWAIFENMRREKAKF